MSQRWTAVGLLVVAGCINFIDRSAVSIALPGIRADLHLSEVSIGYIEEPSSALGFRPSAADELGPAPRDPHAD